MEWRLEGIRNILNSQIKYADEQIEKANQNFKIYQSPQIKELEMKSESYWKGIKTEATLILEEVDRHIEAIREVEIFTSEAIEKTYSETRPF